MRRVEAEEFERHPERYLASDEAISVEREGVAIGVYIPSVRVPSRGVVGEVDQSDGAALRDWDQLARDMMARTGLSEDELADLFDLNKPLPDGPIGRQRRTA
jgi:hypothetical protein